MNSATRHGSGLRRILPMEFFDETAGWDIRKGFPRVVRIGISFPFDQILEPVFNMIRVQDVLHFEIFLVVFDVQRWWSWGNAVWRNQG